MNGLRATAIFLLFFSHLRWADASPANDNFSAAFTLSGTNITINASNIGATAETGEPSYSGNPGGKSVWWIWTAPADGGVLVHTTGSTFDTILTVYSGSSLASLRLVAVNDDHGSLQTSQAAFNAASGTAYRISVDGYNGASGNIQLTLTCRAEPISRPVNDDFSDRIQLRGPEISITTANFLSTREQLEPKHARQIGGASIWWSWTAPISGTAAISTLGSTFDTILALYTGSNLGGLTEIASNDDAAPATSSSEIRFEATANTTYQIAVDGFSGATGEVKLSISMSAIVWLDLPRLLPEGSIRLSVGAPSGKVLILEASPNLENWRRLDAISVVDGTAAFIHSPGVTGPQQFYRARLDPE
jgi:hypothetical protein